MATLENRGNGSWRITISGGYGPDGKQIKIRRTIHVNPNSTVKSQRMQAQNEAAHLQTAYDDHKINSAKRRTFESVYADYIEDCEVTKKLAPQTLDSYKKLFKRELLPAFKKAPIREITTEDVSRFLRKLGKKGFSGTYTLKFYQQLNELFNYAKRMRIIVINPCDEATAPKNDTQEAQYYDLAECAPIIEKIAEHPDPEWKAYFSLAFFCGCRPGELTGFNWSDYDGENITVRAGSYQRKGSRCERTDKPKTKKSNRKIRLTPEAVIALNEWKIAQKKYRLQFGQCWPDQDAVFTNERGYRISSQTPAKRWKKFTQENGLRHLPLYDLRHTNCSLLIESRELSVEEVAARMGHEQTSTTLNIYTHAFANANEKATQALSNVLRRAANE